MHILRRDILHVYIVYLRAHFYIVRHLGLCHYIIQLERAVFLKLRGEVRLPRELPARRSPAARGVYLAHALHDLEQPCPAGDTVALERGRHRKAYRLFRARGVRHDKIRRKRIQPALHTLHRRKEGL